MSNNTKYSASRVFTKNDLTMIKKLLRKDKNPKEMYQYLANKGDRYALFAGVSGSESGFWGKYTLYTPSEELLLNNEKIKSEEFRNIDFRLADEYLKLLESKLNESGGEIVEILDINHEELILINTKACSKSRFSIDNWYLHAVFESLSPKERQGFWTHRLNSSTEFKEQINHHYKAFDMMIKKYISSNGSEKEMLKSWLTNNFYISMYKELSDSQNNELDKIRSSESELSTLMMDVIGRIKTNEKMLGDVVPWVFHEVDADEVLTQDAISSIKSEVGILFWESKEEKLKFLINEISVNRHNRRKKRAALFDVNEQDKFELHLKDVQDVCKKLEDKKDPQILYNYLEANNERYGVIPNGLVRGDSSAGKMATNFLVEKAREHGVILNYTDLKNIQLKIAIKTCDLLLDKFEYNNTKVLNERMNIIEVKKIHDDSLSDFNLPKDAWTLSIPLQIIPIEKHNEIYDEMISNSGSNKQQVEFGLYLTDEMLTEIIRNPSKEKIDLFLDWVNTVSTVGNIKEAGTVFGDYFVESGITLKEDIAAYVNELKKVIPKSDLDIYGVESKISQTKTQPINQGAPSTPPIKYPHNMVDKSILESTYPKSEPNRQLAPRTTNLLDRFKDNETPTNYYLERPSVVLPGTSGFKDFPTDSIRNNHHFEDMIGQLRDNMSSMNNSMDSFDDKYSIPSMPSIPEFSYSGYSSGGSFSFN
ncbi:hypothetical protein AB7W75_03925 [Providencia huaxiensis]|uniref:hypothetical protein n=1 Tax=Providencia TaxID=586 RepID=UPI000F7A0F2C|nr:hypothetical protein [Providencia rettgeri]MBV2187781.1 hypothetical protein [Providencia rettgeri]